MIERRRRLIITLLISLFTVGSATFGVIQQNQATPPVPAQNTTQQSSVASPALSVLQSLPIKGRAPKTGYTRAQFSAGWQDLGNCDVRNYILARDMQSTILQSDTNCTVMSGTLQDPYTAKTILFARGPDSSKVQIDHVVALSDAWQTGAVPSRLAPINATNWPMIRSIY